MSFLHAPITPGGETYGERIIKDTIRKVSRQLFQLAHFCPQGYKAHR
jgi:hypothetical protein